MPTVEFEFVVPGPPFSVNIARKQPKKHRDWKNRVGMTARAQWQADLRPDAIPTRHPLEVIITTFYTEQALDVDNVIKPILDSLKRVIYENDDQVYRVTSQRVALRFQMAFDVPSALLLEALSQYTELVHIAILWEESEDLRDADGSSIRA